MSAATKQEDHQSGQPSEAEELVRSLGEVPEVSPELRSRILVAASQAASESKRQRGWVIAASFAGMCAAVVLAFAFFGGAASYPQASPMSEGGSSLTPAEDVINEALDPDEIISSGVIPR